MRKFLITGLAAIVLFLAIPLVVFAGGTDATAPQCRPNYFLAMEDPSDSESVKADANNDGSVCRKLQNDGTYVYKDNKDPNQD